MRLKATISYDGTHFSGYQIQPNGRTVQGKIENVLTKMHKGKAVRVIASGRTDQGVHAVGQVIHFDTDLEIPLVNWKKALNTMLPDDIEVVDIQLATEDFHARFDVKEKEYRYFVLNSDKRDIFKRNFYYFVKDKLDLKAIQLAANHFLGSHDFTSFCGTNTNVKGDKIRTVTNISVEQSGDNIIFKVRGTGFLYNMVRIIVGTLLEVGLNKRNPDDILQIISQKDRSQAGNTAPAQGLYLWEVSYQEKS
ncbi:tRNA pseudouridine(38-40) synthase TruA [Gracilibacillus massiliensis]|uniref:tRNA pseudouridine(38-40) synthase TruA n=1 Tax=Gracilibacillus massiliensis TaxID=1564956 RepID=UPI00071C9FB8|nr:tRNA pseudouridine(38-40) synthase TruA [Gracilibacillus massiliensis]